MHNLFLTYFVNLYMFRAYLCPSSGGTAVCIQQLVCCLLSVVLVGLKLHQEIKGKGHPATGRGGPRGSRLIKAPDFLDVRHYEGGRSSAIRTGRLYPRRNPWYSLSEAESTSRHMATSWVATKKIPSDTTGIDPGPPD